MGHYGDRPELLTRQEAADRLRISLTSLTRLTSSGQLAHMRIGTAIRIQNDAVSALIAGETPAPAPGTLSAPSMESWPPTESLLAGLDGTPAEQEQQRADDAAAVEAATRAWAADRAERKE